jgi:hypothetical protein
MHLLGMLSEAMSLWHLCSLGDIGNDISCVLATLEWSDLDATLRERYEAEYATFLKEHCITMVSLCCQEFNSLVTMCQNIDVEMNGDE